MHRVRIVLILFCFVFLSHFYSGQAASEDKSSSSRTILISFDGAQPEVIERLIRKGKSCTSGRAGGLICEPLKAVWPAYAGIVTRIFLVDRASYLLSLPYVLSNLRFIPPHR